MGSWNTLPKADTERFFVLGVLGSRMPAVRASMASLVRGGGSTPGTMKVRTNPEPNTRALVQGSWLHTKDIRH